MQLRAAVLGSPVAHSLSPAIHRAGYAALGLGGWSYDAIDVPREGLAGFVAGLDATWRGLSLTMPLKEVAFDVATTVSEVARAAGAINTLVRREDGGWDATNTDVAGLARALRGASHDGTATVVGAGATTRSAVLALGTLGVERVRVAARRPEAVADVVRWASSLPGPAPRVVGVPLAEWVRTDDRLFVATLPPEPSAAMGALVAASDLAYDGAVLLDVVYAEWPTPLARAASAAGMRVVSGVDMLVHQGAEQFRLFTGHEAPLEAMLAAVASYR